MHRNNDIKYLLNKIDSDYQRLSIQMTCQYTSLSSQLKDIANDNEKSESNKIQIIGIISSILLGMIFVTIAIVKYN